MVELVNSGTTGAVVVVGLVIYEQIKLQVAKRNGRRNGTCGFTTSDRDALSCLKRAALDTSSAARRLETVVSDIDKVLIRMDERDKIHGRIRCPLVKDSPS